MTVVSVNADRVVSELDRLAGFSDTPAPAVTRVMLSDQDLAAREYLGGLFREAGLATRVDGAGNLFARWEGTEPDLPAIGTGSHCDAIPYSGRFDGTVGVLGGLEAIRVLKGRGRQPRRSIELIMFTSEEPTRYGIGCLGSRLMAGQLAPEDAGQLTDEDGVAFEQLRTRAGGEGGLADVRLADDYYHAFVELHIEQGPILEQAGDAIGVVTHIAAPAGLRVEYHGAGGHAGGVLMADRRDALLPAAELALEVRRAADELGGADTVATTGVLRIHPGAVNSIPSDTLLEIDIRDIDPDRRDRVLARVENQAQAIGDRHRQETKVDRLYADRPASCGEAIIAAVEAAAAEAGHASRRMVSRAYHDSLFMARVAPIGMIFIPCRDGVSHRPEEHASPEAIAAGVETLAGALQRLSRS